MCMSEYINLQLLLYSSDRNVLECFFMYALVMNFFKFLLNVQQKQFSMEITALLLPPGFPEHTMDYYYVLSV